jgi:predicted  nucleic acid-binding Zn-ribbon protein
MFVPHPDPQAQRKIEAYDAARAKVKIEGNARAYYVLRAEAAEEEAENLRQAWRERTDQWEEMRARVLKLETELADLRNGGSRYDN